MFANMEYRCYCCGQTGHKSPQCPHKDRIPKSEWTIYKATTNCMKTNKKIMKPQQKIVKKRIIIHNRLDG